MMTALKIYHIILMVWAAPLHECTAAEVWEEPATVSCAELHEVRNTLPAGPAGELVL